MKKLLIVLVVTLLLVVCQSEEVDTITNTNLISNDAISVSNSDDYSDRQNDLVYHDYGSAIQLLSNSKLMISQLDLGLKDETAIIYAIDLENNEAIKLYDYQQNQDITYTAAKDGAYKIVAVLSNGKIIDLTPKAMVETSYTEENSGGLIRLK